jgi:uncharacterized membrane protein
MSHEVALLAESLWHAILWWISLAVITVPAWFALRPWTASWHDRGWALARPLGMFAIVYVCWLGAHFGPAFTATGVRTATLVALLVAFTCRARGRRLRAGPIGDVLASEARFIAAFVVYLAMRGFNHDIVGLEKFMDFAFVNAVMHAGSVPVPDPWFAGASINYYYFGHVVTAFLALLSGTPSPFGYNLMLATLFASTFQLAYALVAEALEGCGSQLRNAFAFVAGAWLVLGGNVHGFIYGLLRPVLVAAGWLAPARHEFLISDPTRFVGWDPPTHDRLIHEFPAYAFYLGDLHAHLLDLPAVLLWIGLMFIWLRARHRSPPHAAFARMPLAGCAWLTGIFAMTNAWDALMFGALLGCLLFAVPVCAPRRPPVPRRDAALDVVSAGVCAMATAAPFLAHFHAPAAIVWRVTTSHTPVWQWLVLYGLQGTVALVGTIAAVRSEPIGARTPQTIVLAILTAAGLAFALVPEFVYVKDIYGADFYRANTAFKFGFEAFTLLTLAACIAMARLAALATVRAVPTLALVLAFEVVLVAPLYYGWLVLRGSFEAAGEREWTLDGARYLARSHPEDWAVALWVTAHARDGDTLVEGVGDSYSYGARISTYSGVPALLGWPTHEWLWRGNPAEIEARRSEIDRLYRSKSAPGAPEFARSRYLVVGEFERQQYPDLDITRLSRLGPIVFRAGQTFIVDLAPKAASP